MVARTLAGFSDAIARAVAGTVFSRAGGPPWADADAAISALVERLAASRDGGRVFVIGNGGSAAIAAHVVNDLVNIGRLRAHTLHDAALLTCMANDYGYNEAYGRILSIQAAAGDVLVAISSSGRSQNMLRAAAVARDLGMFALTVTGFKPDNPLRALGDAAIWTPAEDFGLVEVAHQLILHHVSDRLNDPSTLDLVRVRSTEPARPGRLGPQV